MHRFFVDQSDIDTENGICRIRGKDVNHIGTVLRMKKGEQILLSTGIREDEVEYLCEIDEIGPDEVSARILDLQKRARELPLDLYLFQAIPKGDRFETVIEKGVELGVHEIVPVQSARCIVKLDDKRAEKKTARWNALALSAAKQSKRSFVPVVERPVGWADALALAKGLDKIVVPYENAKGMRHTREVIAGLKELCGGEESAAESSGCSGKESAAESSGYGGKESAAESSGYGSKESGERKKPGSVGIFIGPEGGFEEKEILQLQEIGAEIITLGHRILRTDTAGIAVLSMLMLHLEED